MIGFIGFVIHAILTILFVICCIVLLCFLLYAVTLGEFDVFDIVEKRITARRYPYVVNLGRLSFYDPIKEWIVEVGLSLDDFEFDGISSTSETIIRCKNEEDMTLLTMRWG